MIEIRKRRLAAAALAAALTLAGCSKPPAPPPPPPSEVTVVHPVRHEVMEWDEYIGHLESPEMVSLTARVSGFIMQAPFKEGTIVRKGDVLFVIDDRAFKADFDSKKADVAKAESQSAQAKVHLDRYASVRGTQAISEDDYDTAKAIYDQSVALVAAAKAAEETSRLSLEWTRVTAPITGRISRMAVTAGNQVTSGGGPGPATMLTTLVSMDPMYCYVAVPERAFLKSHELASHQAGVKCYIQLEGEKTFPHEGVVDFLDNSVDPNTGTIQLRAVIPNPKGQLTPGLFARLRLPASEKYQAILVPDVAVASNQDERYVLTVNGSDIVQPRPVKLGPLFGNFRSITQGLNPDDRVIINGTQMAFPGTKVAVHEGSVDMEGLDLTSPERAAPPLLPAAKPAAESQP